MFVNKIGALSTMLVIGLTGGIGSGKSTVAELFANHGITIIDTDQLARDLTQPGQPAFQKIITHFGQGILRVDGGLNRTHLRQIIFTDKNERLWLEKLLHPLIRFAAKQQIESSLSPYCIVVIPLLLETPPNPLINRILVIDTPETTQIKRVEQRDNITKEEIQAILKTQVTRTQRLAAANDIIINDNSITDLPNQVEKLHSLYLQLAKS